MRVLVILAHPRPGSLCEALANAYERGARQAGTEVQRLVVSELTFDLNVRMPSPRDQLSEPGIDDAMGLIGWADHLALVFPTWWGTMPACLKGFLDRVLMPGFAFADREDGEGWDKLLLGKTAHLLTTMDTPPWVYRWIYRAPGLNALKRATLGFCGIAPVRCSVFGPVRGSTFERRTQWIKDAGEIGLALRHGALTPTQLAAQRLRAWLASFRLQFHPMAWAAYGLGAAGAARAMGHFSWSIFWLGLACLFFLELATVFTNEEFDFESDRRNRHYGPFTGGSRVLVDGKISFAQMHVAEFVALGSFLLGGIVLSATAPPLPSLTFLAALAVLALGYTVPPLKLCWRGLGELNVGVTHSFGVVLCGYVFQGRAWASAWPWLVSVPLFFAILPAIILSGIPDYDADKAAGKQTIAVRFTPRVAVRMAQAMTAAAAVTAVTLMPGLIGRTAFMAMLIAIIPFAALQIAMLEQYLGRRAGPARIDGLMATSLSFIIWFVAIPLWDLT